MEAVQLAVILAAVIVAARILAAELGISVAVLVGFGVVALVAGHRRTIENDRAAVRRRRDPARIAHSCEWDEKLQASTLDRFLFNSVVDPTDYGLPETLVCLGQATFPACVIAVKGQRAVPASRTTRMGTDGALGGSARCNCDEIAHLFSIYNEREASRSRSRLALPRGSTGGDRGVAAAPLGATHLSAGEGVADARLRRRQRRRFAARLALAAVALLCVGVLFAGDEGAAGAVGLLVLAPGIGLAVAKRIPHVRLGRYVRFEAKALERWWQDRTCGPTRGRK